MLKKNKRRGVAMVEYAVLLALICSVSVVFLDGKGSGSLYRAIDNIIHSVYDTYEGRNSNIAQWAGRARGVHDNGDKSVLTDIFDNLINKVKDKNNDPKAGYTAFSELTDDQKWALRNVGLCVDEIDAGYFYRENNRWYIAWTKPSTTDGKDNGNVNYMVYAFSAGGSQTGGGAYTLQNGQFYVGTVNNDNGNPVTHITDFADLGTISSTATNNMANAEDEYKKLQ